MPQSSMSSEVARHAMSAVKNDESNAVCRFMLEPVHKEGTVHGIQENVFEIERRYSFLSTETTARTDRDGWERTNSTRWTR